jgi:hypothetical protein
MSTEMVTSVTALAVAVLSGAASLYTTRSGHRLQRELHAEQSASAAQTERAAALAGYSAAGAVFLAAVSELAAELATGPREPERCIAKYDACHSRWAVLIQARLPAKTHTAGEHRLAELIEAVQQTARALLDAVEAWFGEVRRYDWQIDKRPPKALGLARHACEDALRAFEDAAAAPAGIAAPPSAT